MFTGIIEKTANIKKRKDTDGNVLFSIGCGFENELAVGQSIAHDGVCLTVTNITKDSYEVIAVAETLIVSNLGQLQVGDQVNLERCLPVTGRLDGHMVQGHVDCRANCEVVEELGGSNKVWFSFEPGPGRLLVAKGSVAVNGVSLTVVDALQDSFSVVVIPHTWQHTNLCQLQEGSTVNIEFDILGKYVARLMQP